MKLERSKNALRNIGFGLFEKAILLLGPFIVRTVFIHTLGAEYLGLNSLFTSILTILNVSELGIGTALVYSMYQSIAKDDFAGLNALLLYYKKVYRVIGSVILAAGLCLIPIIPFTIKSDIPPDINLTILYLVFLFDTVVSYFLFSHYNSLFYAFQRDDVPQKVNIVISTVKYIAQSAALILAKEYYLFVITLPVFTILGNVCSGIVSRKMFPQLRAEGKISEQQRNEVKSKLSGIVVDKIMGISRNTFDSIFISMFLGLTSVAIYNNHLFVLSSVTELLLVLVRSMLAGIGNSVATETVSKNHSDMRKINFIYMYLSGVCTICLFCLYTPFMTLWAGPEMTLPFSSIAMFCIYFYALKMGDVRYTYVQAAGLWREIRVYAIIEAGANLFLNFILGKMFGLNGIIAATIISLLVINFCLRSQVLFKSYFTINDLADFYSSHFFYGMVMAFSAAATYAVCRLIPTTWVGLFIKLFICVVMSNVLFLLVYRWTKIYKESMKFFLSAVRIPETSFVYKLFLS